MPTLVPSAALWDATTVRLSGGLPTSSSKAKLERAKMIQMKNSAPQCLGVVLDLEAEDDELSDVDEEDMLEEESSSAPQIRVQVGRHMVIAHETFYGAEAPSTVIEMIKKVWSTNECLDGQLVIKDPFFANIGLTVDIFHFKSKHKESNVACQTECNAADFS
ncbi:hypothetical protein FA13DRAFT_1715362 [Coprinellus micaceus]|uniref:Uncharacterized protein n=1 Tax=Coprinellus micaceus TaxID=71717 RepID=A0A4Y7SPC5_COPMI|nr:hypothetical protein FA13DRAFT_1715362 [Coprinellus micaceus]